MATTSEFLDEPLKTKLTKILVSTEGMRTEPEYFEHLNYLYGAAVIEPIPRDSKSSPLNVLEAMKQHVKVNKLGENVILWLVVDIDKHPEIQFEKIHNWCNENPEYNLAISNPCFELWLILHHENKIKFEDHKVCKEYFKMKYGNRRNTPKYKNLTKSNVENAYNRAKSNDTTVESGWPIESGCTTVYRVVRNYMN